MGMDYEWIENIQLVFFNREVFLRFPSHPWLFVQVAEHTEGMVLQSTMESSEELGIILFTAEFAIGFP
jgi:hypothetical protein